MRALAWAAVAWLAAAAARPAAAQFPGHGDAAAAVDAAVSCDDAGVFVCRNFACVPMDHRCDGVPHCADGSDEHFCGEVTTATAEASCTEHQFRCADSGYCIPASWRCNREPDCHDLSDELNCTVPHNSSETATAGAGCQKWYHACDDGQCIPELWRCDEVADCADRSDESNCTGRDKYAEAPPARLSFICNPDNAYFPCHDLSFCLPQRRVCNGVPECRDGSDEAPGCSDTCENSTLACSHGCLQTPSGPYCRCPGGYTAVTSEKCRDVDECRELNDACAQHCTNEKGYHTCYCDEQYVLAKDQYNCIAKEGEGILFYSLRDQVRAYYLKSKKTVTIATHLEQAVGVASDGTHVYWTEINEGHEAIARAELADPEHTREVVVSNGLDTAEDVCVEWLTGALYFTDSRLQRIGACTLDGHNCSVLVARDVHRPRALALHPQRGQMYWTDWGDVAEIVRANMDGSEAGTFVRSGLVWPNGLHLDFSNERLYWVDGHADGGGIESIRLDGTGRHEVLRNILHHPYWISVFESTLYWSDWGTNTLQSCEKFTGKERKTIANGRIYGVHAYHPALMPQQAHACQHGLCSDLCLLRGNASYTCVCPEDKLLAGDNHTCHDAGRPQYLVVAGGGAAVRVRYRTLGRLHLSSVKLRLGAVDALAYNQVDEVLYMYDETLKSIHYLRMSDFELGVSGVLVSESLQAVEDMAYDWVSGALYWVDSGRRTLEVWSTLSSQRALLYKFTGDEVPIAICALPHYGRLLVAVRDHRDAIHIDSFAANGTERKHIFEHGFKGPQVRIRYDSEVDRIFISDSGHGNIESAHAEGTGRERFREPSTSVWSVAAAGAQLFWTNRRSTNLYWSNTHEAGNAPSRRLKLDVFTEHTTLHLVSVTPAPSGDTLQAHPCRSHTDPAPCSHICVQTRRHIPATSADAAAAGSQEYACLCPSGLFLQRGSGACEERVACAASQLYCHRDNVCVDASRRCDGKPDCPHGDDEEDCTDAVTHACGAGKFTCGSGECVGSHRRCDLRVDCADASDEADCGAHREESAARCTEQQLQCEDGTCVDRQLVCDGSPDCLDGSDEYNCATISCEHDQFQCGDGTCLPAAWECDGQNDCEDASDEHQHCAKRQEAAAPACNEGELRCGDGRCVPESRRCDGHVDCDDATDEDDCPIIPLASAGRCDGMEYLCPSNMSVCVPLAAKCNGRPDCPRGEDEVDCGGLEAGCTADEFHCGDGRCVARQLLCDGVDDCRDASDESASACATKNGTRHLPAPAGAGLCADGFLCNSGECLDYYEVCDGVRGCADGSDEHGACETSCEGHKCAQRCAPTPHGAVCRCERGYRLAADERACEDVDECAAQRPPPCSHACANTPGSFRCSCRTGYMLRSDKRSCKATSEGAVLYASDDTVRSLTLGHRHFTRVLTRLPGFARVSDVDFNVRLNMIYATSEGQGALHRVDLHSGLRTSVANLGHPTMVAVDWATDNVYFADNTPGAHMLRVCHMERRRCARLPRAIKDDDEVTALEMDAVHGALLYCVVRPSASLVYRAARDGRRVTELLRDSEWRACSALAADSASRTLYVAQRDAGTVLTINYEGTVKRTLLENANQPVSLALFEDHLYYLTAGTDMVARCVLFGAAYAQCDTFRLNARHAASLAVLQAAVQPAAPDACARAACPAGVCVPTGAGGAGAPEASCLCEDGSLLPPGAVVCPAVPEESLAVFAEATAASGGGRIALAVLSLVTVALLLAVAGLFLYRYWQRSSSRAPAPSVHFHNPGYERELHPHYQREPTVDITPPPHLGAYNEFVNPLRGAWRSLQARVTRSKASSQDTEHLSVPCGESDSDVESDREAPCLREKARLL